jgi:hypothetical protein
MTRIPHLLILGVLAVTGCGGGEEDRIRPVPTQAPLEGGGNQEPSPLLEIAAAAGRFSKDRLVAPANERISIEFENQESGVLHRLSIYLASGSDKPIFTGPAVAGVDRVSYVFKTPGVGAFVYRCDLRPEMRGSFLVQ